MTTKRSALTESGVLRLAKKMGVWPVVAIVALVINSPFVQPLYKRMGIPLGDCECKDAIAKIEGQIGEIQINVARMDGRLEMVTTILNRYIRSVELK
jgi:hypothetical protein